MAAEETRPSKLLPAQFLGQGGGKEGEESVDAVKVLAAPENENSANSHSVLTT